MVSNLISRPKRVIGSGDRDADQPQRPAGQPVPVVGDQTESLGGEEREDREVDALHLEERIGENRAMNAASRPLKISAGQKERPPFIIRSADV